MKSAEVRRLFTVVGVAVLLGLRELRGISYTVLLVAVGVGLIVADFRPGSAWGAGMMVFGGLSLALRWRPKQEGE
jgi:membrane-bound ClpP family serine protease